MNRMHFQHLIINFIITSCIVLFKAIVLIIDKFYTIGRRILYWLFRTAVLQSEYAKCSKQYNWISTPHLHFRSLAQSYFDLNLGYYYKDVTTLKLIKKTVFDICQKMKFMHGATTQWASVAKDTAQHQLPNLRRFWVWMELPCISWLLVRLTALLGLLYHLIGGC